MTDITALHGQYQIPPEAVEAAARAAYAEWVSFCVTSGGVEDEYRAWDELDDEERIQWRTHATAALRAGIAAWPGMTYAKWRDYGQADRLVLPLPTETRDE